MPRMRPGSTHDDGGGRPCPAAFPPARSADPSLPQVSPTPACGPGDRGGLGQSTAPRRSVTRHCLSSYKAALLDKGGRSWGVGSTPGGFPNQTPLAGWPGHRALQASGSQGAGAGNRPERQSWGQGLRVKAEQRLSQELQPDPAHARAAAACVRRARARAWHTAASPRMSACQGQP